MSIRRTMSASGGSSKTAVVQRDFVRFTWRGAKRSEYRHDILLVNMFVDRRISAGSVSVREAQGENIRLEITVNRNCNLSVRVPEWTKPSAIAASRDFNVAGTRLHITGLAAGESVVLDIPYTITQDRYTVRHQGGYGREDFVIKFKGDSAISVEKTGGGLDEEQYAEVCGLERNPPLYQRKAEDVYAAEPEPLAVDAKIQWHPGISARAGV